MFLLFFLGLTICPIIFANQEEDIVKDLRKDYAHADALTSSNFNLESCILFNLSRLGIYSFNVDVQLIQFGKYYKFQYQTKALWGGSNNRQMLSMNPSRFEESKIFNEKLHKVFYYFKESPSGILAEILRGNSENEPIMENELSESFMSIRIPIR